MGAEKPSTRTSQDELLRHAVAVLRRRYRCGGSYPDLSPAEALALGDELEAAREAPDRTDGVDRDEALALAHRLVDDDQPELSPLWPRAALRRPDGA